MPRYALALLLALATALSSCGASASSSTTAEAASVGSGAPRAARVSPTAGFEGEWLVTWVENQTVNALTLVREEGQLVGRYISDDGEVCRVREGTSAVGAPLNITVVCMRWDVVMDGTPTHGGTTVEGDYFAYGTTRGRFVMRRR